MRCLIIEVANFRKGDRCMTINIGDEIVAAYLQYIKGCEFIQQNLYTAMYRVRLMLLE